VNPENGDQQFRVTLTGNAQGERVAAGVWQLLMRNSTDASVRVDVWTNDDAEAPEVFFTGKSAHDGLKIGSPGAARSAVTCAAYTTKVDWTDVDGQVRRVGLALDDIADFSSEGPLRNGAQKPDVAAPGAMIVSCRSKDWDADRASLVSDEFAVEAGTSMATPVVSGLVALMLADQSELDPEAVRTLLREQSRRPGLSGFDPKWGWGLIDAAGI